MRRYFVCLVFLITSSSAVLAQEQDKPRVFVQQNAGSSGSGGGKLWGVLGSKSTGESQGDATEFGKDVQQDCPAVTVTEDPTSADYTILLNVVPKKNRDLRANSQVQVANRVSKIIGTNFLHTVGNAAKDACQLIAPDWQEHGRVDAAATSPVLAPGVTQPSSPPPGATVQPASGAVPPVQTGSSTSVAAGGSGGEGESMGDASRRAKQHAACMKLTKENPSITCK